jgi:hypothetical protein
MHEADGGEEIDALSIWPARHSRAFIAIAAT